VFTIVRLPIVLHLPTASVALPDIESLKGIGEGRISNFVRPLEGRLPKVTEREQFAPVGQMIHVILGHTLIELDVRK
jgi:hypothetical protein